MSQTTVNHELVSNLMSALVKEPQSKASLVEEFAVLADEASLASALAYMAERGVLVPPKNGAGEYALIPQEQAYLGLLDREVGKDSNRGAVRTRDKLFAEMKARRQIQQDISDLKSKMKLQRELLKLSEERIDQWAAGEEPEQSAEEFFAEPEQLSLSFKKKREKQTETDD